MSHIYIIGGGGVGSWLLPAVCLLKRPKEVTIIDGDTLEEGNLNRQLFMPEDIGMNKAGALAAKYDCQFIPQYFTDGQMERSRGDWLLVCADNNAARMAAYNECNNTGCQMIVGANETTSAEAYYYRREWRDTKLDPLTWYPEIATDKSDDPRRASIGCTGEQQRKNVQLVTANFMAAALMQHLFVLWSMEAKKMGSEGMQHLPVRIRQNLTKFEVMKVKD